MHCSAYPLSHLHRNTLTCNSSVCALVSFPRTSHFKRYIYTPICMYECAYRYLCIHMFYVWHWHISQNVSLLDPEQLLLCGRDSSGHQYSATAACGVPLSSNSTQGRVMLPCFSVFKYEKSPHFLLGLGSAASHHLGDLE